MLSDHPASLVIPHFLCMLSPIAAAVTIGSLCDVAQHHMVGGGTRPTVAAVLETRQSGKEWAGPRLTLTAEMYQQRLRMHSSSQIRLSSHISRKTGMP